MNHAYRLIRELADGRFHSGEQLGAAVGVSRSSVWKNLRAMEQQLGLQVFAVPGRGYRLAAPIELLDRDAIARGLQRTTARSLLGVEVLDRVDSTNLHLLRQGSCGPQTGRACIAESQETGKGRRGRQWESPYGANLYLSLLWGFGCGPGGLAGLSIAAGVAVAEALDAAGAPGVGLKWPNDVILHGRKLGGILIEMAGEAGGPCRAVIGVGINVGMPRHAGERIDQPWTDLASLAGGVSRNALAVQVLDRLVALLPEYESRGLEPFMARWQVRDVTRGRAVEISMGQRKLSGTARGVDANGALMLETGDGLEHFSAGEVSLRMTS